MKLSIIVPAYNEEATIYRILQRVDSVELVDGIKKELVVVNDCSNDHTNDEINRFIANNPGADITYLPQPVNRGKGSAIRTGIQAASGDYIIIQDADLEYDPNEYNLLLNL